MDSIVSPILLYIGCALGALGVALALPRRGLSPQVVGALVAGVGIGAIFLAMGLRAGPGGAGLPNFNFYIFSVIALGASLRVISHPRPVYAALYFILTILSSVGLYVLLHAEFMAFALLIVYAGAILITYLFVIMLATESPTADAVEALADYDRYSREPGLAAVVGFILIASLTTMFATGTSKLSIATRDAAARRLEDMPLKVERALRNAGLMEKDERIAREPGEGGADGTPGRPMVDLTPGGRGVVIEYAQGQRKVVGVDNPKWPADLMITNVERVGWNLLADHPGGIEAAGVVLLMAMLGAVVLARKKVEMDEQAKLAAQNRHLVGAGADGQGGGA